MLIVVKGAGDLATGVACRLLHSGFQVILTETPQPTTVRCTVAFSQAVYRGEAEVEGLRVHPRGGLPRRRGDPAGP